jgi:ribosome-associated protein YbcJ (S4-like RNA binding protein)
MIIDSGDVRVNGNVELRKRNKIVRGSKVQFLDKTVAVV